MIAVALAVSGTIARGEAPTTRPVTVAADAPLVAIDSPRVVNERVRYSPDAGTSWDLSGQSVRVSVRNPTTAPVAVRVRLENFGARGLTDACTMSALIDAGATGDVVVRAVARPVDPTYKPFEPFMMYFRNINVRDNTVDPTMVAALDISSAAPVEVTAVRVQGEHRAGEAPFFPFVDRYGQYIHSDWPGKVRSDEEFARLRAEEQKERESAPGPTDWSTYGGWKNGPRLEATGFFRLTKHEGKWWFVDPEGYLFWSNGPTGVGMGGDVTPVTDREHWFESLPARDDPLWGSFYSQRRGATYRYYRDREWVGFDIARANLVRKYGAEYADVVADLSHERLRSWGFNTIANWSSDRIYLKHRTPYTVAIHTNDFGAMRGSDGHSLPDVYDPRWEPAVHARMEQERGKTANDPWCIGYFIDNERAIGWRPRAAAVGEVTLKAPPEQPSKLKFIEQLKSTYTEIDKLNTAWGTTYASWDALREAREAPAFKDKAGMENAALLKDCGDFGMAFCERYFSVARDAVKKVAPNNLFLGSRFYGHVDPAVVALAGRYWDVISYNIYDNPPDGRVNQLKALDLPILSTEWGVGSDPTQTPFRGSRLSVDDPQERSNLIAQYVERALRHPNIVGAHFFQYRDQPLSGRPDGEATLRGFVNIVDTPNFELVQTMRKLGYGMYETRAGAK